MSSERKPNWRGLAIILALLALAFLAHLMLFLRGVSENSLAWMTLIVWMGLMATVMLFCDKWRLAKLAAAQKDEAQPNAIKSQGDKKDLSTSQRIWLGLAISAGMGIFFGTSKAICEILFPETGKIIHFAVTLFIGILCVPLAVLVLAKKPIPGEVFTDEREKMIAARGTAMAGVCLLCTLLLACAVVWFVCKYQRIDAISIDFRWLLYIVAISVMGFSWTQVTATWFIRRRGGRHGED